MSTSTYSSSAHGSFTSEPDEEHNVWNWLMVVLAHHECSPRLQRCLGERELCKVASSCHLALDLLTQGCLPHLAKSCSHPIKQRGSPGVRKQGHTRSFFSPCSWHGFITARIFLMCLYFVRQNNLREGLDLLSSRTCRVFFVPDLFFFFRNPFTLQKIGRTTRKLAVF